MCKKDLDAISNLYLESIVPKRRISNADRLHRPIELKKVEGVFSVDPIENQNLMGDIGKWVVYDDWSPSKGTKALFPYKIMHLQKNFRGDVVYRGENQINDFGIPIDPNEVRIIDIDEAKKIWNYYRTRAIKDHVVDEFDPNFDIR
jgi:hypothetical protein